MCLLPSWNGVVGDIAACASALRRSTSAWRRACMISFELSSPSRTAPPCAGAASTSAVDEDITSRTASSQSLRTSCTGFSW